MGELDTSNTALAASALCPAGMPIAHHGVTQQQINGIVARAMLMSSTMESLGERASRRKALYEVLGYGKNIGPTMEQMLVSRIERASSREEYVGILTEAARS